MNALKAGASYFALLIAIDYLTGMTFFPLLEMYVVETGDLESFDSLFFQMEIFLIFPLKLIAAWFISRWMVRQFAIVRGLGRSYSPGIMGLVAFLLLISTRPVLAIFDIGPGFSTLLLTVDFFGAILLAFFPRFQSPLATTIQLERAKNPHPNSYPRASSQHNRPDR